MNNLSKFLGSPKEVEINGQKITIKPIKVSDIGKLNIKNPTPEQTLQISKTMVRLSIEEWKDLTDEELDEIPLGTWTEILEEINLVSGFKDERTEIIRKRIEQSKARQDNS